MKTCRNWSIFVFAALLTGAVATASEFDVGMEAYRDGDYQTAWKLWQPLAEQGSTDAQYGLAIMLEKGQGTEKNPLEAFDWYLRAAEAGDANAQFMVAVYYSRGVVEAPTRMERLHWYYKAAKQGHTAARIFLAQTIYEGNGTPKDNILAYFWAQRATENVDAATLAQLQPMIEQIQAEMTPEEVQEAERRLDAARNEAWRSCITDDE
jgi:TPR repeat protein